MHTWEEAVDSYFEQQLKLLRDVSIEFAHANPSLAPFLAGHQNDPDVERLLEAVAFQNAMLVRKLDEDFPLAVGTLTQLVLPHYMRPIPASTIIGFVPDTTLKEPVLVPAGTELTSVPVEGCCCRFRTTAELAVQPLELLDASLTVQPGAAGKIRLSLKVTGGSLADWQPRSIRFFLSGDHTSTTELYLLLSRYVTRVRLSGDEAHTVTVLPASCLKPVGFGEEEASLPYPPHAFSGYRLLQEYFSLPEKFLFFDLCGCDAWQNHGTGPNFNITIQLENLPFQPRQVRRNNFILHAVPAINVFPHHADPIVVDHRSESYRIRPSGIMSNHYQILSVDQVVGCSPEASSELTYAPFEQFSCTSNRERTFHTQLIESHQHGRYSVNLTVALTGDEPVSGSEVLSVVLTCTNGTLADGLSVGEITLARVWSNVGVSARNITPVRPGAPPPLGAELLPRLTAHLRINYLSLGKLENLRGLLELYLFPSQRCGSQGEVNLRRIFGIEALQVRTGEHMFDGGILRGSEISITVRQDHFSGPGDLFLFGSVLNHFLSSYASLQSYTRLKLCTERGHTYQWPVYLGQQPVG